MAKRVFLGVEQDNCGGQLRVKNRSNRWVSIPRGKMRFVSVAIDGEGWWYWRCGSEVERSRGEENYRQRVKQVSAHHMEDSRRIMWQCYDLM